MKKKILIVDDEEAIRFTMELFLSEEGHDVGLAADYDEAVSLISKTAFDLLFIDIVMKGKSGIELLRTVKKANPNAQIIIITGAPSADTAAEALRLGALDYMVKPVRQHDLIKMVNVAFRHKKLSDEKERYRMNMETIFQSVKDGIVMVDEEMKIVEANMAAVHLCGLEKGSLSGEPFEAVISDCNAVCVDVLRKILVNKKSVSVHHIECHRKGRWKQIVSISASPLIDRMENFSGCVLVLRDETRLHHLEKNIKESKAFNRIIGTDMQMRKIKERIKVLADVQTTVLITGESGTGKELAVEALHSAGDRNEGPLVKVNCGALADSILESEMFGHVQGAFTGAGRDRIGRFKLADGGIIFLDEIGDISAKMQLQLLRVIETMSFERVGSSRTEHVDVRVVAATNRDLSKKVAAGEFREDLFYRLKVVEINLPPLRERKDDIPLLTRYMIEKFNNKLKRTVKAVTSDVEKLFHLYPWPGNIRQFENSIEHAFILGDQDVITVSHLPLELQKWIGDFPGPSFLSKDLEAESIERALERTDGNKAKAARILGMSRRTIYRKMNKYDIHS